MIPSCLSDTCRYAVFYPNTEGASQRLSRLQDHASPEPAPVSAPHPLAFPSPLSIWDAFLLESLFKTLLHTYFLLESFSVPLSNASFSAQQPLSSIHIFLSQEPRSNELYLPFICILSDCVYQNVNSRMARISAVMHCFIPTAQEIM